MRTALTMIFVLAGCGSDGGDGGGGDAGDDPQADAGPTADGGVVACPRAAAPADGPRRVLVSHPYGTDGAPASAYRVLELSSDGVLAATDTTFELGRAVYGTIAFTPDGEVAFVPQEDGTIGVVAFDDDGGAPRVVSAGVEGVYAGAVRVSPAGDRLRVLDQQWREHGGGVYEMAIGCDGALGPPEPVAPARLPEAMFDLADDQRADDRAVIVARDVLDSPTKRDAHLVSTGAEPAVLASVDAFPDEEALIASAALTSDGRYLLLADNSELSGIPNRIAAVEIDGDALVARQILTPIEDPFRLAASPFDGTILVASGYGDALIALDYAPGDEEPFAIRGELDYVAPAPQLPGELVMIERGALRGLVLVAEVGGVRRVRFAEGGVVTDLGVTEVGEGVPGLIGAIGVAP